MASLDLSRWLGVTSYLSQHIDFETSALEHGALVRRRGVRSAADLLHLALLYGPGGLSLRSTACFAVEAGIADVPVAIVHKARTVPMRWRSRDGFAISNLVKPLTAPSAMP